MSEEQSKEEQKKEKKVPIVFYVPESHRELFRMVAEYRGFGKDLGLMTKTIFYGQMQRTAPNHVKKRLDELIIKT